MQEKESVNFFYYSIPMKIKKYQQEQVLNNKNRQPMRDNKQNQANWRTKTFYLKN